MNYGFHPHALSEFQEAAHEAKIMINFPGDITLRGGLPVRTFPAFTLRL